MSEAFESWAIVEVMGHSKFAGFVSEQTIGGCSFVRVDVPEVEGRPAFTKLLGQSAIFGITPTTEETARKCAEHFRARPMAEYGLPQASPPPAYLPCSDPEDEDEQEEWGL